MTTGTKNGVWAQLVCKTDTAVGPIPIAKAKFIIGRAKGCDLCLGDNKLISAQHCLLEWDDDGNKVWLKDTSTNGTLVNQKIKVANGQRYEIKHGDEIFLVYRKNKMETNVGYVFEDLGVMKNEACENTEEYDFSNKTQIEPDSEEIMNKLEEGASGKSDEPAAKKVKLCVTETSESSDKLISDAPKVVCNQEVEQIEMTCTTGKEDLAGNSLILKSTSLVKKEVRERDDMEETLLCSICQDILHDCISLQPCMHSFCAGCYSPWMDVSSECPQCRNKVERISRNHIVNNLVEVYLKEHPEKKRSEDDLKELDTKNKITQDMLYPKKKKRLLEDLDDDEFSDGSEVYSDEIYSDDDPLYPGHFGVPVLFQRTGYIPPAYQRPLNTVCPQCPGFITNQTAGCVVPTPVMMSVSLAVAAAAVDQAVMITAATATSDSQLAAPEPGTSATASIASQVAIIPPQFVCLPQQTHIMCQCCMQPMPDRRMEHVANVVVPTQQCILCYRAFCHMYWGCKKPGCFGCIGPFSELNFGEKCLTDLINENLHESQIFREYMKEQNLTWKDILRDCLVKLNDGTYTCTGQNTCQLRSTTVLCYSCGLRNFRELAYQFRRDVPQNILPASATSRPDCYWGKNCRTQRTKPHHAQRFNHICEQIRWNV